MTNKDNNNKDPQEFLNEVLQGVGKNASRVARLFMDEDTALAKLENDEVRELVADTKNKMGDAVTRGSYDDFAFCVSILAHAGVLKGGRDKWKTLPMITELVWRSMRESLKEQIADEVSEFLKEFE